MSRDGTGSRTTEGWRGVATVHADSPSAEPDEMFRRPGRHAAAFRDARGQLADAAGYGPNRTSGSQLLVENVWPASTSEADGPSEA